MWTNRKKKSCFYFIYFLNRENKSKKRRSRKQVDDVTADVAQQECSNNKYYISIFRYL